MRRLLVNPRIERAAGVAVCRSGRPLVRSALTAAIHEVGFDEPQANKLLRQWERVKDGLCSSNGGWGEAYSLRLWALVRERVLAFGMPDIGEPPSKWTDTAKRRRPYPQEAWAYAAAPDTLFADDEQGASAPAEERIAAAMERISVAVEGLYAEARQQRGMLAKAGGNGHVDALTVVPATE